VKRAAAIIAALCLACAVYCADAQPLKFRVYYLIKGEKIRKPAVLSAGESAAKAFPLRVKEFLQPSKYYNFNESSFKKTAAALFSSMPAGGRHDSVKIAGFIKNFVSVSVTASNYEPAPSENAHEGLKDAAAVLRDGAGNIIERYRLITALLRYAGVPSRVSYWNDSYIVEYYYKPVDAHKAQPSWQVIDLTGAYDAAGDKVIPGSWNPVDKRERLNEEWESNTISVRMVSAANIYSDMNEAEALAAFTSIESGAEPDAGSDTGLASFYLFKTVDYEAAPENGSEKFQVELTMPFNEVEPLKTMKYFIRPISPGLTVKMGRSRTYIKPVVKGIIYSLPVDFEVKMAIEKTPAL
jgi:hypothetical protein